MGLSVDSYMGNKTALALSGAFMVNALHAGSGLAMFKLPEYLAKGGGYQFLTIITLTVTSIYFGLNILYHCFHARELRWLKTWFSALCFSMNFVVFTCYWGLRLYSPQLVLYDGVQLDSSLDLQVHAYPFIFVLVDYTLFMDAWSLPYSSGYMTSLVASVCYWMWLEFLVVDDSLYPYPCLNIDEKSRLVLFTLGAIVMYSGFHLGKTFHPSKLLKFFILEIENATFHLIL